MFWIRWETHVIASNKTAAHRFGGYCFTFAILAALSAAPAAFAADLPAPAPVYTKAAAAAAASDWYSVVDGMYDRVGLPSYALGMHSGTTVGFLDAGPVSSFNPTLDGSGLRGGVGYHIPGTAWRLELGGSFVEANGKQTQSGAPTPNAGPVRLDGTIVNFLICEQGLACTTNGQLTTAYQSWQINGKAAYDVTWGGVAISPFLAVFGGSSRNDQTLHQSLAQTNFAGPTADSLIYDASTSLRRNDVGGRIGLDTTVPLIGWLAWNASGSVGLADRSVALSGTDSLPQNSRTSSISVSTGTTALVANLESGFTLKPTPWLSLRVFGGISFDDRVPGISSPTAVSDILPTGLVPGTAAGINFSHETSYYAGSGASWKF
jgi:hypothetical protein